MTALESIIVFWQAGGWLMPLLFCLALILYISALRLLSHIIYLRRQIPTVSSSAPNRYTSTDPAAVRRHLENQRHIALARINRRIRFVSTLTSIAPLAGLLGTVSGMLTTFAGMSARTTGRTLDAVAGGVSEALITTQTGLLIAIPALVLLAIISRQRNEWQAAFAHMESDCLKQLKEPASA